jgi:hypothetical protein
VPGRGVLSTVKKRRRPQIAASSECAPGGSLPRGFQDGRQVLERPALGARDGCAQSETRAIRREIEGPPTTALQSSECWLPPSADICTKRATLLAPHCARRIPRASLVHASAWTGSSTVSRSSRQHPRTPGHRHSLETAFLLLLRVIAPPRQLARGERHRHEQQESRPQEAAGAARTRPDERPGLCLRWRHPTAARTGSRCECSTGRL